MPLHKGKGRTISAALAGTLEYIEDPGKTADGELISSYECGAFTADVEFSMSKNIYRNLTGREQGKNDVIAYHARQSFRPGEVDAETANRIGHELAMRFTKGKYAFVVCTHIDKSHIHNHVIWNSTRLDCKGKFRNFIGSSFVLRRVSDRICVEHGLSIVKNPKPSRGHYGTWLGENRKPSNREKLRHSIDAVLEKKPADFDSFLDEMRALEYEVKRGKYLAFRAPGEDGFTRCRESSLSVDYTEDAIRERIAGRRGAPSGSPAPARTPGADKKIGLLIDIQSKIQQGKGVGYQKWATVHNLKEAARTLVYLQENGIGNYPLLEEKTSAAKERFSGVSERMKELDDALRANAELQKQIVTYSKTRAVYAEYRKAGYSKKFRAAHEANILLHQAAKAKFDELGYGKDKKLPRVADLRADYAVQLTEKKKLYNEYKAARAEMRELLTIKANADRILGLPDISAVPERERRRARDALEL